MEQFKFRDSEDFEELRLVRVALERDLSDTELDPRLVRVAVEFFDEDAVAASIAPTRAFTTHESLKPEGAWTPDVRKTVSATYIMPRGTRANAGGRGSRPRYFGHVVRVFYGDQLQDVYARPSDLPGILSAAAGGEKNSAGGSEGGTDPGRADGTS